MFLEQDELHSLLTLFPKFELCYEISTHNKVYDSLVTLAIPVGEKWFAWFTDYQETNACILINSQRTQGRIVKTSFSDKLAYGTIYYGTLIHNESSFCVEDMYYCMGKYVNHLSYVEKLKLLKQLFSKEMSQLRLCSTFLTFGLPMMTTQSVPDWTGINYSIASIQYRFANRKIMSRPYNTTIVDKNRTKLRTNTNTHTNTSVQRAKKQQIFTVVPDTKPDIYFLMNPSTSEYVDIAFVPDYKTSVLLNTLFRNIKENTNLDAIEESDDEEDFQNCTENKYVYMSRAIDMNCEFNPKFKRWVPLSEIKQLQ